MSKEYIAREATCKNCIHNGVCYVQQVVNNVEQKIKEVGCDDFKPAADVEEVRHGKWVMDDYTHRYRCSICEAYQPYETIKDNGEEYIDYWDCDYCPLCGAKMDGKGECNG